MASVERRRLLDIDRLICLILYILIVNFLIEHVDIKYKKTQPCPLSARDASAFFAVRFAMPAGFWCNLAYPGGVFLGVLAEGGWDGRSFLEKSERSQS